MIPRLIQTPLLVQDEERDLTRRARAGDDAARRKLVEANMRLVCNIAKNYHAASIPFEDLVQEGAIGLMKAIDRFDPEKGCRFSTYAIHWVRQAMGKAMVNRSRVIRLPAHVVDERKRLNRMREAFEARNGRPPTTDELAMATGLPPEKVVALEVTEHDCLSLETGRDDFWDYTTILADTNCEDPEGMAFKSVDRERFQKLVAQLPDRERTVISLRLGLGGELSPMVLMDLANRLGISREGVRQIEAKAIRTLRRMLRNQEP